MKYFFILLLLQCVVVQKTKPVIPEPQVSKLENPIQIPVYVMLNQEVYRNGKKKDIGDSYNKLIAQFTSTNQFTNIVEDLEKAELIVEIEIETRKINNPYLPFITALTFTLVPFFEEIEFSEKFKILKKNGDITFQTSRIQKVDYWFGLVFFVNGMMQFAKEENENRFGFEEVMIEKINRDIVEELSQIKLIESHTLRKRGKIE